MFVSNYFTEKVHCNTSIKREKKEKCVTNIFFKCDVENKIFRQKHLCRNS